MSDRCTEPYTGGYHSFRCIRDTEDGTHVGDGCVACGEIWDTDDTNCRIGDDVMDDTACNHHWVRVVFDGQRLNDRCRTCGATRRPRPMGGV
jgi:hypothetical protein